MTDPMKDRRPIPARRLGLVKRSAARLSAAGVTPNQISIFGMAAAVAAGFCLGSTPHVGDLMARILLLLSSLLIVLRGLSNMLDGMVAVELGKGTPVGALYNEFPDRLSDVAIFVGAGYAIGGLPELGYAAAIVSVLIAFARVAARSAGAPSDFSGWMAKQQRMFLVAAVASYLAISPTRWQPDFGVEDAIGLMGLALLVIVVGGVYTIVARLRRAASFLGSDKPKAGGCNVADR